MSLLLRLVKKSATFCLLIVLFMSLSLVGCGGKGSMEGGNSDDGDVAQVSEDENLEEELFAEEDEDAEEEDADVEEGDEDEEEFADGDEEEGDDSEVADAEDGEEEEGANAEEAGGDFAGAKVDDYTVQASDTLWTIAARPEVYGSGWLYPLIYKANKELLRNPNNLKVGATLKIPRGLSDQQQEAAREEAMADEYLTASTTTDPTEALEEEIVEAEESTAQAVSTAPVEKAVAAPVNDKVAVAPGIKKKPVKKKRSRRNKKSSGSGGMIVFIVVLLGAAGGAYYYIKKKRDAEEDMDLEEDV